MTVLSVASCSVTRVINVSSVCTMPPALKMEPACAGITAGVGGSPCPFTGVADVVAMVVPFSFSHHLGNLPGLGSTMEPALEPGEGLHQVPDLGVDVRGQLRHEVAPQHHRATDAPGGLVVDEHGLGPRPAQREDQVRRQAVQAMRVTLEALGPERLDRPVRGIRAPKIAGLRSEEHTSELQSREN